jgi:hypothetical protein
METVSIDGKWKTDFGARVTLSTLPLSTLWTAGVYDTNDDIPMFAPYSRGEIKEASQQFGTLLGKQDPWVPENFKEFFVDMLVEQSDTTKLNKLYHWIDPRGGFPSVRTVV